LSPNIFFDWKQETRQDWIYFIFFYRIFYSNVDKWLGNLCWADADRVARVLLIVIYSYLLC